MCFFMTILLVRTGVRRYVHKLLDEIRSSDGSMGIKGNATRNCEKSADFTDRRDALSVAVDVPDMTTIDNATKSREHQGRIDDLSSPSCRLG
jgi:hypothetical protein